ncbi:hypothetical protein D9M72_551800 [compost metagenome]
MVAAFVEFEHGVIGLEGVAQQDVGLHQLVEHPVHGGQSGILVLGQQDAVDIFRAEVALCAGAEHFKDPHPRRRGLQAGALEVDRAGPFG